MIKELYKKIFPSRHFSVSSFSQHGEDVTLRGLLGKNFYKKGFYVDVGAHHPFKLSNTALFYKWGWNGINIEPGPDLFKRFTTLRRRDVNLNYGVSAKKGELDYFVFSDQALNSFDANLSKHRESTSNNPILHSFKVKTQPLSIILDKYLPSNTPIIFLNIDTEGLDLEVLRSNDWTKYRPIYVLVEIYDLNERNLKESSISKFLSQNNYELVSWCKLTAIFKDKTYSTSSGNFALKNENQLPIN